MIAKAAQALGVVLVAVGIGAYSWPAGVVALGVGFVVLGATEERG